MRAGKKKYKLDHKRDCVFKFSAVFGFYLFIFLVGLYDCKFEVLVCLCRIAFWILVYANLCIPDAHVQFV